MDGWMMRLRDIESRLPPGFRFHPSDEELVCYYLRPKVTAASSSSRSSSQQLIAVVSPAASMLVEVDLHVREPWDLPAAAKLGDRQEWYFFSWRDRKYATGSRTNRRTPHGYWKATGKDKVIHDDREQHQHGTAVGMRKTLVFYFGRAPNGRKSGWVMQEFRLITTSSASTTPPVEEDWVLCRVFHKGKGPDDHGGRSNDDTSSTCRLPALCSPPQPADNLQLFPINGSSSSSPSIISAQLAGDDGHGLIMGGQDAMPAPGGHLFVDFSPDAVVASSGQMTDMDYRGENLMPEMEVMVLLHAQGDNYFSSTS